MTRTAAEAGLVWESWGDSIFVVYQPSSGETHVFNETTRSILACLRYGPLPEEKLKDQTEAALRLGRGELAVDDFTFATMRLEELGLIERQDNASAA